MMRVMIVAATQFAPVAGDIDANVRTIAGLVRAAGAEGARVVVFAELSLTGYEPSLIRDTPGLFLTEDDPRLAPHGRRAGPSARRPWSTGRCGRAVRAPGSRRS